MFFSMDTPFLNHVWWKHVHTNNGPTAILEWNCLIHSLILLKCLCLGRLWDLLSYEFSSSILYCLLQWDNSNASSNFRFSFLCCCCLTLLHSCTKGSFLIFSLDSCWYTNSFALKTGFSLALCLDEHWYTNSFALKLGSCLANFFSALSRTLKLGSCLANRFPFFPLLMHLVFF